MVVAHFMGGVGEKQKTKTERTPTKTNNLGLDGGSLANRSSAGYQAWMAWKLFSWGKHNDWPYHRPQTKKRHQKTSLNTCRMGQNANFTL